MARTGTTNHDISKFADGDHPKDYPGQDLNYNWDTTDKLLWGSGTSFPATFQVGSKFLRTDQKKAYENTGTQATPVWTLVIDGTNTGGGTGTDEYVKISANDTTAGYLNGKLVGGTSISLTENNDGANETLTIDMDAHTHTASEITDFDTEVSNNTDVAANTAARHDRLHNIDSTSDHTGVSGAVENNLISFDANGLPKDSGYSGATLALDEKVKVSANDTTPGYLNGKLVQGANITLTENNDGGNETFTIALGSHASTHLPTGGDALTTGTPVSLGLANAVGTANSFARSDHVHDVINLTHTSESPRTTSTALTLNGTLTLTSTSTVIQYLTGTATGFSVHLPNATTLTNGWKYEIFNTASVPVAVEYNDSSALVTIGAASVGFFILQSNSTSNGVWLYQGELIGTSTGIRSYTATSSTLFSTTSATDVVISDMTITPSAGTYTIWYHSSSDIVGNNNDAYVTIYRNGAAITDSVRRIRTSVNTMYSTQSTMTIVTFDGAQSCEVYVRTSSGTLNVRERSIILIRIGN